MPCHHRLVFSLLIAFVFFCFLFLFLFLFVFLFVVVVVVVDVVCLMPLAVRTIISNDHLCRRDVAKDTQDENERITDMTLKLVKRTSIFVWSRLCKLIVCIRWSIQLSPFFFFFIRHEQERKRSIWSHLLVLHHWEKSRKRHAKIFFLSLVSTRCSTCCLALDLFMLNARAKMRRSENHWRIRNFLYFILDNRHWHELRNTKRKVISEGEKKKRKGKRKIFISIDGWESLKNFSSMSFSMQEENKEHYNGNEKWKTMKSRHLSF